MCYRVYNWRHLVKATEVTAGLTESNGSLPPGGLLKVICGLSACTPGSAQAEMLCNKYGKLYLYLISLEWLISIVIPNFVKISLTVAKIRHSVAFQNGSHPPSWIF